ncbi:MULTISPECIES: PhzF family phenazine biosynthesis protein [unclassified Streptomyces]|uniref:PhzF family phenazine biosynthesis protein n=1 Tax=unclassified Streptomyces TaxID=2593676 RepID=UPI001F256AE4|nr:MULTISPECIES: PhzF family phenazine biosynthesis protein [unclassified Streptomyces]
MSARRRGGSPTAVLEDAPFTDEERCRIPTELGTSHAVFLRATGIERGQPAYTLRFFTAQDELPACGHGTVAALAVLAEREGGDHDYRAVLRTAHRSFDGRASRNGDGPDGVVRSSDFDAVSVGSLTHSAPAMDLSTFLVINSEHRRNRGQGLLGQRLPHHHRP